jgi:hypothetical protein
MVIKKLCCGEVPVESVTDTKNGNVPDVVGMPEIVPVVVVRAIPGGKDPPVTAQ